ncbi:MAG: cytochrome C, partial [Prolixibacteraceae bacterium]|nr:cytochrome C [Prolixibacteraceae bacterium]
EVVKMNTLLGNYADNKSKIIPVKVHRSKLIYDAEHKYLIGPHLFGKDSTAYWKNFDWHKASEAGMEKAGLEFSGKYDFAETEMSWPINHMVAPMNESLQCADCHAQNSRIAALNDFYLIGRNRNRTLDYLGIAIILFSIAGVSIHSVLRIIKNNKTTHSN